MVSIILQLKFDSQNLRRISLENFFDLEVQMGNFRITSLFFHSELPSVTPRSLRFMQSSHSAVGDFAVPMVDGYSGSSWDLFYGYFHGWNIKHSFEILYQKIKIIAIGYFLKKSSYYLKMVCCHSKITVQKLYFSTIFFC